MPAPGCATDRAHATICAMLGEDWCDKGSVAAGHCFFCWQPFLPLGGSGSATAARPAQAVVPSGGLGRCRCRQRAAATAPNVSAMAIRTMINHVGNVEVPTVEMAARPPFTLGRVGAGTASKARRDRALVPLAFMPPVSCFATPAGKVTASDGRPGLGVCPPPAAGIVSQYWFSALSAEPVQPGAL